MNEKYTCAIKKTLFKLFFLFKFEQFNKQIRWKALFFENETGSLFNYGLQTRKCPPQHKDLVEFKYYFQKMISNVQFRRVNNDFQSSLRNDIRSIQSSKKTIYVRR